MAKSLHELSPRAQLTVFGLLCVLAIGGAWQVLISPALDELTARRARLSTIEIEVNAAQAVAVRLPLVQREVRTLEASLRETEAVIPEEKDPQDVLRNLHALASESLLDLASFTPQAIVSKSQYTEWPIKLGLEGSYHDLGRFFDRLASMSRLISVSDLTIKVNGTGISASCVATTFVFQKSQASTAAGGQR